MSDTNQNPVATSRSRRRKYVTHSSFQWKYSLSVALSVLVLSTILSTVQFGAMHKQARLRAITPAAEHTRVTTISFLTGLGLASLTGLGVCVWSILATHRICGPLVVLEKYFGELGENRIPKVRSLRKKDELKELFATFSTAMDKLRAQRLQEKQAITAALNKLGVLMADCDDQRRPNLEQAKVELDKLCNDITVSLGEDCMADATERRECVNVN